ncbi:MAG: bifunctional UDP-N-acetylglucosamine diphosphorylase/glucosamine-1-phosphate N-acetyltransferase GlmU [Herpetosiphon sp.]
MRSSLPKVLHPVCGIPLLDHVLRTAHAIGGSELIVVVAPDTLETIRRRFPAPVQYAVQHERRGTADALLKALPLLEGKVDRIVVLYGPDPTMRVASIEQLIAQLDNPGVVGAFTTFTPPSPHGYGRILRDQAGHFLRIVEQRDASESEQRITECNQGVVAFDAAWAWQHLAAIQPSPTSGELYLTDLVEIALREHGAGAIQTFHLADPTEGLGVNDRVQLAAVEAVLRDRILVALMEQGVTIVDPGHTYVDVDVTVGADTVLLPGTMLRRGTTIGRNCTIGPHSVVDASTIADRCTVNASVVESAVMDEASNIGPFSHLRAGAHLGPGVHIGNFGEVNRSMLHTGVKMGHFSYIGDADIGPGTNIGAGTVTANYDGHNKHKTTIGAGVFIGSDSIIVAPRTIGDGARTGAGSVVTHDVAPQTSVVGVPARLLQGGPPHGPTDE